MRVRGYSAAMPPIGSNCRDISCFEPVVSTYRILALKCLEFHLKRARILSFFLRARHQKAQYKVDHFLANIPVSFVLKNNMI